MEPVLIGINQKTFGKIKEEIAEFEESQLSQNQKDIEGVWRFTIFSNQLARLSEIDPELALERTNKKFIFRFSYMEQKVKDSGKRLSVMSLDEMEAGWVEVKPFKRLRKVFEL